MLLRAKTLRRLDAGLRFISLVHKIIPRDYIRKYLTRFDVLHFNSFSTISLALMTLSKRPNIFVLHSAPYASDAYRRLEENTNIFVAPSEFTADNESGKLRARPLVIHHGVNVALFNSQIPISKARRSLRLPQKAEIVLWNDRISPEKDFETFLEAIPQIAKKMPNVYFFIKMRGIEKRYFETVRLLFRAVMKRGNVKVMDKWVSHERLPFLYRAADALVSTSVYENFGLKFVEAMACGTPVVAANTCTGPEVLGEAGTFYAPRDSSDLAEKLIELLSDRELREKLSCTGKERVDKHFRWDSAAKKYLSLYESLV